MKSACVILILLMVNLCGQSIDLQIGTLNQLEKENDDTGELVYKVTGVDPFIIFKNIPEKYDPEKLSVLAFEYQSLEDIDDVSVYFGPPISEKQVTSSISVPASPKWKTGSLNLKTTAKNWKYSSLIRIDLGSKAGQKFKIRNFKLREFNEEERQDFVRQKEEIENDKTRRKLILDNLQYEYPVKIESVKVDSEKITVSGTKPEGAWFELVEVPIYAGPLSWDKYRKGTCKY